MTARPLRVDAEANRVRILSGAREVFLESGLRAPMQDIARRSDVGIATLYRRFPTRDELVTAVFLHEVAECVDAVVDASRDPDPWRGFSRAITGLLSLDTRNRGFIRQFLSTREQTGAIERAHRAAEDAFWDLTQRAKRAGALSRTFTRRDLDLILTANAGFELWNPASRLDATRRFTELVLAAYRTERADEVTHLTDPPSSG